MKVIAKNLHISAWGAQCPAWRAAKKPTMLMSDTRYDHDQPSNPNPWGARCRAGRAGRR